MPRTIGASLALSLLLHAAALLASLMVPWTPPRPEDAVLVELADLPRAAEFLPPRAGIVRGERPRPAPPPIPAPEAPVPEPPEILRGRVPDLPVSPDLPPEKEFATPREKEPPSGEPPARRAPEPPTARAAERPEAEKAAPPAGGSRKTVRDLTPSLGEVMIMARAEAGAGRGQEASRGTAAGTEARAREKGEVAEERGGGAHLTPLNAPEIQYISYFAGIKRKIELVWQYPWDAKFAGVQGDLRIDFVIRRDGSLESVVLIHGSGHKALDDEALRSIRVAAPFDPIPARYTIPHLSIRAHFIYEIHALRLR